jgi:glycosyltransferase involved in cell wall biosynthesis
MKIAFLSTFYPFRGGIAQFNGALFRALELEHEVQAFNFTTQYPAFLFPGKTQYVEEKDNADEISSVRVLNSMNPATYGRTVSKIKAFQPDVLIIGYWMPYMAPSLGYVAGKMKNHCKVISIIHNATPHEKGKLDKQLSTYFFKKNTKCIALSNAVKNDINTIFPDIEVEVLLHPVYEHFGISMDRVEAKTQLSLPKEKKHVLFFGLIRDYKGLDLLIEAMALLPEDFHLTIAGEVYGSFDSYKKQIERLGLQERIHLHLKYIPDEDVKLFFSMADVVALPYRSATQSGIVAIAKHFKKPVVATNVGGLSEFIKYPMDGAITSGKEPQDIAKAIQSVCSSNSELSSEASSKPYSWNQFASELVAFAMKSN